MFRLLRTGRRTAPLATLAALVWAASAPVQSRSVGAGPSVPARPMFEATVLAQALPSVLTPPSLQEGWRLVSMVAEDIDADGDLDVVASDGSLHLVVWTNDGSGRLTRQPGRETTGWRLDASRSGFTDLPAVSESAVQTPVSSLQIDPRIACTASGHSEVWWDRSSDVLRPAFVSTRTPRGPPVSRLLT
jgi:hypothetical protein